MILKLGTRKSLLAWSQSQWVAEQVQKQFPNIQVEMIGIETQGDKILDKPLSQIEGKEFFTAELDHALLRKEVDFTVHSLKDLSLERPESFKLAAVPKRELPHDVVVFSDSALSKIMSGKPIRVGTSSPRRLALLPDFFSNALPRGNHGVSPVEFVQIRGNVNTRLSRLHEPETSERKLEAVVLAFAGLERLSLNPKAHQELMSLRKNTHLMVVPISSFPSAPAQGALAVECLAQNQQVLEVLSHLHDADTLKAVQQEREILKEWGGGCHLKLGATSNLKKMVIAGIKPSGEKTNETRNYSRHKLSSENVTKVDAADIFDFAPLATDLPQRSQFFVAHIRAFEHLAPEQKQKLTTQSNGHFPRVWASGWSTWKKLAQHGVWVEGCIESDGYSAFAAYQPKVLLNFDAEGFGFLSHDQSDTAPPQDRIATYTHRFREVPSKIFTSEALFWGSGLSFETVWSKLQAAPHQDSDRARFRQIRHHCGPGKTFETLKRLGFDPQVEHEL